MIIFAYAAWSIWTYCVVGIVHEQYLQDIAEQDMKTFQEAPHKYKIKDIQDK